MNLIRLILWEFAIKTALSIVVYIVIMVGMLLVLREAWSLVW